MNANDFKIYRVGGSVRDELLGLTPTDLDFTAEATEEQFRKAFPESETVGKKFPVFIVNGNEVALTRSERSTGPRTGDVEITGLGVPIEVDLARRDFTINSIARCCLTGNLIDPHNGVEDLNARRLRTIFTAAFHDDPIRILRGARLAAKLGFTVEVETALLMRDAAPLLEGERKEMIVAELEKMYKQVDKPSRYFTELVKIDALKHVIKPLDDLRFVTAGPVQFHHDQYGNPITAFQHTMLVIDRCKANGYSFEVFMACLCHDFGKAATPSEILPHHYGHELRSADIAYRFLEGHRFSSDVNKLVVVAAKHHMTFHWLTKMKAIKVVRFLKSIRPALLNEVIRVANCDHPLTEEQHHIIERFRTAVKETKIEIPGHLKGAKLSEFVEREITKVFQQTK